MSRDTFHPDELISLRNRPHEASERAFVWTAAVVVGVTACSLIGLFAINKPHHPAACAGMSPFDCTALVQEEAQ